MNREKWMYVNPALRISALIALFGVIVLVVGMAFYHTSITNDGHDIAMGIGGVAVVVALIIFLVSYNMGRTQDGVDPGRVLAQGQVHPNYVNPNCVACGTPLNGARFCPICGASAQVPGGGMPAPANPAFPPPPALPVPPVAYVVTPCPNVPACGAPNQPVGGHCQYCHTAIP